MKLPDTAEHASPEALLAALDDYITRAHAHLAAREMVELSGLDSVVATLCERVLAMPTDAGKPFADQLDVLQQRLGQLQDAMIETQAAMKEELQASQQRQRASRAYRSE